jgi:hypothetical protein
LEAEPRHCDLKKLTQYNPQEEKRMNISTLGFEDGFLLLLEALTSLIIAYNIILGCRLVVLVSSVLSSKYKEVFNRGL